MKILSITALSMALALTACAGGPKSDPVFRDDAPPVNQGGTAGNTGSNTGGGQQPAEPPKPKGSKLQGQALYNQMSGYSYKGCYPDGSTFAETTLADGQVRDDMNGGGIVGSWNVSGDTLCYKQGEGATCVNVYKNSKGLHFYMKDSGQYIASTVCPMSNEPDPVEPDHPQPDQPTPDQPNQGQMIGTQLKGQSLYSQMSGLSYAGCYPDGSEFSETTLADGRIRDDKSGNISGQWSVSGDQLCYANEGADKPFCVLVSKDRRGLHFYFAETGQYVASTVCPMLK